MDSAPPGDAGGVSGGRFHTASYGAAGIQDFKSAHSFSLLHDSLSHQRTGWCITMEVLISASILTAPEVLLFSHVAPCYIMTPD